MQQKVQNFFNQSTQSHQISHEAYFYQDKTLIRI